MFILMLGVDRLAVRITLTVHAREDYGPFALAWAVNSSRCGQEGWPAQTGSVDSESPGKSLKMRVSLITVLRLRIEAVHPIMRENRRTALAFWRRATL